MAQAITAAREGTPSPCLLPEIITDSDQEDFLKAA